MLKKMQSTWAYNHKHLLVTLSLVVALIWQSGILQAQLPKPEVLAYEQPVTDLDAQIQERAQELYKEQELWDLERYRRQAIDEMLQELLTISETSPYLDFDALKEKYGY
jgi:cell division protein FtsL